MWTGSSLLDLLDNSSEDEEHESLSPATLSNVRQLQSRKASTTSFDAFADTAAALEAAGLRKQRVEAARRRFDRCGDPHGEASAAAVVLQRLSEVERAQGSEAALDMALSREKALQAQLKDAEASADALSLALVEARKEAASMTELAIANSVPPKSRVSSSSTSSADPTQRRTPELASTLTATLTQHSPPPLSSSLSCGPPTSSSTSSPSPQSGNEPNDGGTAPKHSAGRRHIDSLAAARLFHSSSSSSSSGHHQQHAGGKNSRGGDGDDDDGGGSGGADLRAALGRALEKLAADLYSSSASVLSELIANADDASYSSAAALLPPSPPRPPQPPSSPTSASAVTQFPMAPIPAAAAAAVVPTVAVTLRNECLRFSSNEDGMTFGDLSAICDIGASTKKTSSSPAVSLSLSPASIGHKGVGFKSVFLLSNTPHVASARPSSVSKAVSKALLSIQQHVLGDSSVVSYGGGGEASTGDDGSNNGDDEGDVVDNESLVFKLDTMTHGVFGLLVPTWVNPSAFDEAWKKEEEEEEEEEGEGEGKERVKGKCDSHRVVEALWNSRNTRGLRILLPLRSSSSSRSGGQAAAAVASLPGGVSGGNVGATIANSLFEFDPAVLLLLRKIRTLVFSAPWKDLGDAKRQDCKLSGREDERGGARRSKRRSRRSLRMVGELTDLAQDEASMLETDTRSPVGTTSKSEGRTVGVDGFFAGHQNLRIQKGRVTVSDSIESEFDTKISSTTTRTHDFILVSTTVFLEGGGAGGASCDLTLIFPTSVTTTTTCAEAQPEASTQTPAFSSSSAAASSASTLPPIPASFQQQQQQQQQWCYCSLPVQPTDGCLPFGVHSNGWKLTASRQELHKQHPFNLLIRARIAPLFVSAMGQCEELRASPRFFPAHQHRHRQPTGTSSHRNSQSWWWSAAEECTRLLQTSAVACALGATSKFWRLARFVVLPPPSMPRHLLPPEALAVLQASLGSCDDASKIKDDTTQAYLQTAPNDGNDAGKVSSSSSLLEFADPVWADSMGSSALQALGCKELTTIEVVAAVAGYHQQQGQSEIFSGERWLATQKQTYFDDLFSWLHEVLTPQDLLQVGHFKILPIKPLEVSVVAPRCGRCADIGGDSKLGESEGDKVGDGKEETDTIGYTSSVQLAALVDHSFRGSIDGDECAAVEGVLFLECSDFDLSRRAAETGLVSVIAFEDSTSGLCKEADNPTGIHEAEPKLGWSASSLSLFQDIGVVSANHSAIATAIAYHHLRICTSPSHEQDGQGPICRNSTELKLLWGQLDFVRWAWKWMTPEHQDLARASLLAPAAAAYSTGDLEIDARNDAAQQEMVVTPLVAVTSLSPQTICGRECVHCWIAHQPVVRAAAGQAADGADQAVRRRFGFVVEEDNSDDVGEDIGDGDDLLEDTEEVFFSSSDDWSADIHTSTSLHDGISPLPPEGVVLPKDTLAEKISRQKTIHSSYRSIMAAGVSGSSNNRRRHRLLRHDLAWEAWLLSLGSQPHLAVCPHRRRWMALSEALTSQAHAQQQVPTPQPQEEQQQNQHECCICSSDLFPGRDTESNSSTKSLSSSTPCGGGSGGGSGGGGGGGGGGGRDGQRFNQKSTTVLARGLRKGGEATMLRCGHLFHMACVREWMWRSGGGEGVRRASPSCPYCRQPILNEVVPLSESIELLGLGEALSFALKTAGVTRVDGISRGREWAVLCHHRQPREKVPGRKISAVEEENNNLDEDDHGEEDHGEEESGDYIWGLLKSYLSSKLVAPLLAAAPLTFSSSLRTPPLMGDSSCSSFQAHTALLASVYPLRFAPALPLLRLPIQKKIKPHHGDFEQLQHQEQLAVLSMLGLATTRTVHGLLNALRTLSALSFVVMPAPLPSTNPKCDYAPDVSTSLTAEDVQSAFVAALDSLDEVLSNQQPAYKNSGQRGGSRRDQGRESNQPHREQEQSHEDGDEYEEEKEHGKLVELVRLAFASEPLIFCPPTVEPNNTHTGAAPPLPCWRRCQDCVWSVSDSRGGHTGDSGGGSVTAAVLGLAVLDSHLPPPLRPFMCDIVGVPPQGLHPELIAKALHTVALSHLVHYDNKRYETLSESRKIIEGKKGINGKCEESTSAVVAALWSELEQSGYSPLLAARTPCSLDDVEYPLPSPFSLPFPVIVPEAVTEVDSVSTTALVESHSRHPSRQSSHIHDAKGQGQPLTFLCCLSTHRRAAPYLAAFSTRVCSLIVCEDSPADNHNDCAEVDGGIEADVKEAMTVFAHRVAMVDSELLKTVAPRLFAELLACSDVALSVARTSDDSNACAKNENVPQSSLTLLRLSKYVNRQTFLFNGSGGGDGSSGDESEDQSPGISVSRSLVLVNEAERHIKEGPQAPFFPSQQSLQDWSTVLFRVISLFVAVPSADTGVKPNGGHEKDDEVPDFVVSAADNIQHHYTLHQPPLCDEAYYAVGRFEPPTTSPPPTTTTFSATHGKLQEVQTVDHASYWGLVGTSQGQATSSHLDNGMDDDEIGQGGGNGGAGMRKKRGAQRKKEKKETLSGSVGESGCGKKGSTRLIVLATRCWEPSLGPDLDIFSRAIIDLIDQAEREKKLQRRQRQRLNHLLQRQLLSERAESSSGIQTEDYEDTPAFFRPSLSFVKSAVEAAARSSVDGWEEAQEARAKKDRGEDQGRKTVSAAEAKAEAEFAESLAQSLPVDEAAEASAAFSASSLRAPSTAPSNSPLSELPSTALNAHDLENNLLGRDTADRHQPTTLQLNQELSSSPSPTSSSLRQRSTANTSCSCTGTGGAGAIRNADSLRQLHSSEGIPSVPSSLRNKPFPERCRIDRLEPSLTRERNLANSGCGGDGSGCQGNPSLSAPPETCVICGAEVWSCCGVCCGLDGKSIPLCAVPATRGGMSCFEIFHTNP